MRLARLLSSALLLRLVAATASDDADTVAVSVESVATSVESVPTPVESVEPSPSTDAHVDGHDTVQTVPENSDVVSLTTLDFNSVVDPEALILVEFFAPWCSYCKALAPHYEEAATALKEQSIKLAKVDCVAEEDLCKSYDVKSYPTLKVFRNGTPTDYTGPREAKGIIMHLQKLRLPAVVDLTLANLDEFKSSAKFVIVAYGPESAKTAPPEFVEVADKHRDDHAFGFTTDASAIAAEGEAPPAVVLYRAFDEPRVDFTHPTYTADELTSFLAAHAHPLIDVMNGDTVGRFRASGLPLAYIFLNPDDPANAQHIELLRPAAQKHRGALNFVHIDAVEFAEHAESLGLPPGAPLPAVLIQDLEKHLKYPLSGELTAERIEQFADAYVAGTLKPKLRSQPVPERQEEAVWTVVSDSFSDVVFDDAKDVFIELYAPWCGHCKTLKPIWDQLGERYAPSRDHILIAKMDATENDLPPEAGFTVPSFPTIKFKKAGSREFIAYYGERTLDDLIAFVDKNAVNPLDVAEVFSVTSPEPTQASTAASQTGTEVSQAAESTEEAHQTAHDEL